MTDLTVPLPAIDDAKTRAHALFPRAIEFPLWGLIALALAAAVALTWSRIASVWNTGAFFDPDDAMRAVQVRDLLAGQSWFDMTAYRLDPPYGMFTHWSRVIDVPLAGLELFFRLFLSPEYAERATRLVFPFALFTALLRLSSWCATILWGPAARYPAVWITFFSGAMWWQFAPGRIHHSPPQIVLLLTSLSFFLLGLDAARTRAMAFSAAAMALSIAISLENVPFFAVMIAALPALFVIDGAKVRGALGWFAAGSLIAFPLCFIATVSPARYLLSTCDAYSAVHFGAVVIGALGLAALAALAPRLTTLPQRALGAGLAGAATLVSIVVIAPQCLGDPYVGIDPLLRDLWLSRVPEAQPLLAYWGKETNSFISTAVPVLLGLAVALAGGALQVGTARRRWLVIAAAIAIGFAGGLWQVRIFSSVYPIAMTPIAIAAIVVARRLTASFSALKQQLLAGVLCIAVSPLGLLAAMPATHGRTQNENLTCPQPQTLAPLVTLAPARIVAPIELGSSILALTPHSVFAAPYHRNNHGNRIVVDAFLAKPDDAERILHAAKADLVVWCPGEKSVAAILERAPSGLAAALSRGEIPDWLSPLPPDSGPLRVFAIRK